MNNFTIILTSSVISAIISALISAYVSLRTKDIDYKHNYYKEIINKRLNAYQFLETQISVLKSTVLDDDQKAFHMIFAYGREKFIEFQQNLTLAMAYSIWIDEETVEAMQDLNDVFFSINTKTDDTSSDEEIISIGKTFYKTVAAKRKILEQHVRRDLFDLHNLNKFFRSKTSGKRRFLKIYEN